jgi:hypothetical protein
MLFQHHFFHLPSMLINGVVSVALDHFGRERLLQNVKPFFGGTAVFRERMFLNELE